MLQLLPLLLQLLLLLPLLLLLLLLPLLLLLLLLLPPQLLRVCNQCRFAPSRIIPANHTRIIPAQ